MARRIRIFDTTLRDGEQAPGISLDVKEKVEIAEQLARLSVDVVEAGFPVTSQGDFEAVHAIAASVGTQAGACSPSRSVVSKIVTVSVVIRSFVVISCSSNLPAWAHPVLWASAGGSSASWSAPRRQRMRSTRIRPRMTAGRTRTRAAAAWVARVVAVVVVSVMRRPL